jgi:hypothetical protein
LDCAITPLLRQDGMARCRWWNELSEDRWVLRREGDALIISILWLRYVQINDYLLERSDSHGKEGFSTMCDFWKFAAKVRLSASRFIAHEKQQGRHVPWGNRTEYRYLEATLEQRKQNEVGPKAIAASTIVALEYGHFTAFTQQFAKIVVV